MLAKNLTLSIFNGLSQCRRCQAMSKRTGLQCAAPVDRHSKADKCRFHGGRSTGPVTEQGLERCAKAKTNHVNETRAKRAERSRKSAELHQLVAVGNEIGLFDGKAGLKGRKPKLVLGL